MNCDVFISYRRDGGDMAAMHIYQALKERGYQVFYDLEVLRAGKFNEALLDAIDSCRDFVLVLSPHALDRCAAEDDWVRREIAEALKQKKNIVPIMMNGFTFPDQLPEEIDEVRFQNGLSATTEYFSESIDRLCSRYLTAKPEKGKAGRRLWIIGAVAGLAVLAAALVLLLSGRGKDPKTDPVPADLSRETAAAVETSAPVPDPAAVPETEAPSAAPAQTETPAEARSLSEMDLPVLRGDNPVQEQDNSGIMIEPETLNGMAVFGSSWKREQIQKIVFTDTPAGKDAWDVSEAGDGSVMMQVEEEEGKTVLTVHASPALRLPEGANRMFQGYAALEAVEWNGLVDFSGVRVSDFMFEQCVSLTEMDLRGMDLRKLQSAGGMFQNCSGLRTLHLDGVKLDSLTNLMGTFAECHPLRSLDLSGFNTSRVVWMTGLFQGCQSLEELDLSTFDTSRVREMQDMFAYCHQLETLTLGTFDTSRVTNMHGMFALCGSLKELDVSKINTSRAEDLGSMFEGCSSLLTLDVSGFDTANVQNFFMMFADCSMLDSLDLSSWKTGKAVTMENMFRHCESLRSLNLSGFDLSSVETMAGMFEGCCQLTDIGTDPASFGKGNTADMYLNSGLAGKKE